MFRNQKLSNAIHRAFYRSMLLVGFWIKNFNWASILDVNRRVHRLGPKLHVKSLCTNHVSSTFHDGSIGSFCNSILLWCVSALVCCWISHPHKKSLNFLKTNSLALSNRKVLIFMLVWFSTKAFYAWICQTFLLSLSKGKHEFFSKSHQWRWQSIMLHHEMWPSSVHTHHYAQVSKAWTP
jgi:hypothetical protein